MDVTQLADYDLVIHGGWIMVGMVKGLEKVKSFQPRKLMVFGVGFTNEKEADIKSWIEANKLAGIPFFYYQGGMNPDKMGIVGKTMVKMATKKKPEYVDYTNRDKIQELVDAVK